MEQRALNSYRVHLRRMEERLGDSTTFLSDLALAGTEEFGDGFAGVFSSDNVPPLTVEVPYAVSNLDRSGEPGSHWVALAHYPGAGCLYGYDSFGRKFEQIAPKISKRCITDSDLDAEQKVAESNCGQRCLAWLLVFDELGPDVAMTI